MRASPHPATDRLGRLAALGLAALVVGLAAPDARADEAATSAEHAPGAVLEAGRARFVEGLQLEKMDRWADALDRFHAAAAIKTTSRVRFHIALCEEHLGQATDALTDFEAAWEGATAESAGDVVTASAPHLERLRRELARLTLRAAAAATPGMAIRLDGRPVGLDRVIGVAPGRHRVVATAPGIEPIAMEFELAQGAERTLTLQPTGGAAAAPSTPPAGRTPGLGATRTAGLVVGGAGILALGASAAMFALRGSALDEVRAGCSGALEGCPDAVRADYDRGRAFNTAGNVLLLGGAAGVGAGVLLFVLGRPAAAARGSAITPAAPGALAGLSYGRTF